MSVLIAPVVIHCSRCKAPITVNQLETTQADPDRTQLHNLLKMLEQKALCPKCQAGFNYYANMGRGNDWQAGRP